METQIIKDLKLETNNIKPKSTLRMIMSLTLRIFKIECKLGLEKLSRWMTRLGWLSIALDQILIGLKNLTHQFPNKLNYSNNKTPMICRLSLKAKLCRELKTLIFVWGNLQVQNEYGWVETCNILFLWSIWWQKGFKEVKSVLIK